MAALTTPHDRYFKASMSDLRIAKDFFQHHLPAEILNKVDLSSLRLCNESFLDQELSVMMTDLLFSVNINNAKGYLYLLLEHKSTVERFLPFYILRCQCRIMHYHIKDRKRQHLPIVFPMVFYNGEKKYNGPIDIFDLFDDDESARKSLCKPICLLDVGQISDQELKSHDRASVTEFMMKHVRSRELCRFFEEILPMIQIIADYGDQEYIIQTIIYMFEAGHEENNIDEISRLLSKNVPKKIGDAAMTLAERIRQEGHQQGHQEGISLGVKMGKLEAAKKMLVLGVDIEMIARFTGLMISEIKNLQNETV